jgi:hypothetical protein
MKQDAPLHWWMRPRYSTKTRLLLLLPFVAIFACTILSQGYTIIRNTGQIGDVTGVLRGDRILVVRMPEAPAILDQLEVYKGGTAARAILTTTPIQEGPVVRLSATTWQAIEQLRVQWCEQPPTLRPLRPDEPFYDVGLRCSDPFAPRRVQVPTDQVPPALAALLDSVPAPRK